MFQIGEVGSISIQGMTGPRRAPKRAKVEASELVRKKNVGRQASGGGRVAAKSGLWQDEAGEHAEGGGDVRAQLLADMRFRLRLGAIRRRWCSGNWDSAITWRSRYSSVGGEWPKKDKRRTPRRRGSGTMTAFGYLYLFV